MGGYPLFNIRTRSEFSRLALDTFRFQYESVPVYRKFCTLLKIDAQKVDGVEKIPFMPVELFKDHKVISQDHKAMTIFESSGTTGTTPSRHFIADPEMYRQSFETAFRKMVGDPENMVILALLPSYMEREGSSLVYMANQLIKLSADKRSGFYLNQYRELTETLKSCESDKKPTLLLGVTFALLELAERFPTDLGSTIVMETGGMKGRRKEMVREEVHRELKEAFGLQHIYSEYGMTELLSQAYSAGNGRFRCPPWMQILTRDPEDPFSMITGRTGGINVIDLANRYSCSFIATQDLGKLHQDGSFEVIGRFDHSDIRGCNLMAL